jgi:hypothetical protein
LIRRVDVVDKEGHRTTIGITGCYIIIIGNYYVELIFPLKRTQEGETRRKNVQEEIFFTRLKLENVLYRKRDLQKLIMH